MRHTGFLQLAWIAGAVEYATTTVGNPSLSFQQPGLVSIFKRTAYSFGSLSSEVITELFSSMKNHRMKLIMTRCQSLYLRGEPATPSLNVIKNRAKPISYCEHSHLGRGGTGEWILESPPRRSRIFCSLEIGRYSSDSCWHA